MKAADRLQAIGVFNPYGAAQRGESTIYIDYRPQQNGRAYQCAAWQVVDASGKKTDPGGHWQDYGHKTFNVFRRERRASQLEAAKAWAAERYGITEWGKITGLPGALFPVQTVTAVKAALREVST